MRRGGKLNEAELTHPLVPSKEGMDFVFPNVLSGVIPSREGKEGCVHYPNATIFPT